MAARMRSIGCMEIKCGRGLAPDSRVSVNKSVTDPPLSGASPLPPLIGVVRYHAPGHASCGLAKYRHWPE
ncbi:hypothetical protein C4J94_3718 [Pseudomonas sp. R5-89-07]|nr:hypothetical protein C4J94_3718 [Pseudomonas sp. R5-89-07]